MLALVGVAYSFVDLVILGRACDALVFKPSFVGSWKP